MPKRKREHGEPPLRKSTRLGEKSRRPPRSAPIQNQRVERSRVLPSPSASGSAREDQRQARLPEGRTEKSANDASFESDFGKAQRHPFRTTAGRKRKHEKEPTQSGKRPRKSEPAESPPKQSGQLVEIAPETAVPITKSSDRPEKEPGVSEEKEGNRRLDPISHWAAYNIWPDSFLESGPMTSLNNAGKRQRTLSRSQSDKDQKSRSYSQNRKAGEVPEQYTPEYERHIFTKGLDMVVLRGEEFVSGQSERSCIGLKKITRNSIKPTIFPQEDLRKVINLLGNRNEAIVNRDITTMIVPPLAALYFGGDSHLEHVVDEVNADWNAQCVLEGPRIRPDLAVGLFSSAFTEAEIGKLETYKSVYNWTQFTAHMALLRIEQEADKYRSDGKFESLSGQVLVFSISHDQQDVRLYGHYAIIREEKWTYYRYSIGTFNILKSQKDLLALYNFVQNVLESHAPDHVKRLKDALSALPEPSTLSFCASGMSLDDDAQQHPQERHTDGFTVPALPGPSQNREMARTKEQNDRLLEQITKQNEQISKLMEQLEEERKKHEEEREKERQENSVQREQLREIMSLLRQA